MKKKERKLEFKEMENKREDFNLETRRYAGREFDRLIVLLSGDGLTLSLGYIENVIKVLIIY